jgi:tRNA(fMet)-specific endonuclease VapC
VKASRSYLLDTNITGYLVSGRSEAARNRMDELLGSAPILVSTVTQAEVLFGLELKPRATRLRVAVAKLFDLIQIRPWDSEAAHAYGRLRAQLESRGTPIAEADLMIAAHALSLGAILVTHDNDFRHVRAFVTVEDWATDLP